MQKTNLTGKITGKKNLSKRFAEAAKLVDGLRTYKLDEILDYLAQYKAQCTAKFDETVEVVFRLGVDPKQSDQMIRGSVIMPAGLGKTIRIAAIVPSDKFETAKKYGATVVGDLSLIDEIKGGRAIDFDACITVPSLMPKLASIAKILGPKGLMPNVKTGTVNDDIVEMLERLQKGQVDFKVDKTSLVHAGIGKLSFSKDSLKQNFLALHGVILAAKPAASKGVYIRYVKFATSQGPSLTLDLASV